jgi:hypothetical protein
LFAVAEEVLSSLGALHKRLTLTQFRVYIDQLTEDMTLQEFEEFADYLIASVEVHVAGRYLAYHNIMHGKVCKIK